MPTRLLLDGEDLAGLMRRVRNEMGPGAVVVKAERVRTGGVAGFFAKEHYELTVEVPDPGSRIPRRSPVTPRRTSAGADAVGISALLAAADAAEAREAEHPQQASAPVPASPVPPAAPAAVDAGPRVSTDAQTFASLLASIDDMADAPTPAAVVHPTPAAPVVAAAPTPAPTPVSHPSAQVPPVLPARFAPRGAMVTPVRLGALHPGAAFPDLAPDLVPDPPERAPAAPRAGGGDRRALLALGIPPALLGAGPLDDPMPLSDLLVKLGRPPTLLRTPGAIVAVVGESAQALAVASQLAERARQDPHDVVLAGEMLAVAGHGRRLLSPSAAARHRARVADGDQISIVALGVGQLAADWPAAAELLAELGPDQAWAVVDSRRKPTDLRAWMSAVAGARPFDVAAAVSLHETQEPGTVLDLGLPVGWIDGLPATPVVWAAVLSERLEVGIRWD